MSRETTAGAAPSLETYFAEINRFPLLTVEEEQTLARAYRDHHDTRAAHRLVTANLRFVVKVAYEYRAYGLRMADLIQEGNLGLMKGVQKFDPDRGFRLVSYAVWWIRAYIQNHILNSYSLVKLGTTQAQRKLFFSLARTRREIDRMSGEHGAEASVETAKIAEKLGVKPAEVEEMTQRMGGRDVSLDAPVGTDDGAATHGDFLAADAPGQDDHLGVAQQQALLQSRIAAAVALLDDRERYIVEHRLMSDDPMTLTDIGHHFRCSRERAHQLETRAKAKLRAALLDVAAEIEWLAGTAGAAGCRIAA